MNKIHFIQTMICVPRPFCEGTCTKLPSFSCHHRLQLPSLCLPLKSCVFHPKAAEVFSLHLVKHPAPPHSPNLSQQRNEKDTFSSPGSLGYHRGLLYVRDSSTLAKEK